MYFCLQSTYTCKIPSLTGSSLHELNHPEILCLTENVQPPPLDESTTAQDYLQITSPAVGHLCCHRCLGWDIRDHTHTVDLIGVLQLFQVISLRAPPDVYVVVSGAAQTEGTRPW